MKKGNKILVVLIVIIILLLISGGAFAYAYFATDLLKTDAELFSKYLSQIIEEDGFFDKSLEELQEKKKQTPYENTGFFTIMANLPEEFGIETDKINDLTINFSGKSDVANNKVEKTFEINYGKGVTFPVTFRQYNDTYGLKFSRVSSKFVAIRNENLKEFAQKFGVDNTFEIPDKIELTGVEQKVEFSAEEIDQLKQIYGVILNKQLTKENFSSVKTSDGESYTLELNGEQQKNVIIRLLEATKQNTLLIDKVNEFLLQISENAETLSTEDVDDLIESINEKDASEISNLKITLGQKDKMLNKIIVESGNNKLEIIKTEKDDNLIYSISLEIEEMPETTSLNSLESTSDAQINLYLTVQYKGLQTMSTVQENYGIVLEVGNEDENIKYEYGISNNVQFKDIVSVAAFDGSTAVFLNDYDGEVVTNFISQLVEKILEVNKEQMQELGLEENENPLIYSNPITMGAYMFYNMASETIYGSEGLTVEMGITTNE